MEVDMKTKGKSVKGHTKMGVYEKFSEVNSMECRTCPPAEERNMKCGWFKIVNGAVQCFQTPFNVALIVEQLSNYTIFLRENIEMDKDSCIKQKKTISGESIRGTKLNALGTECTPEMNNNASAGDHSKDNDDWSKPIKMIPTTCFFKKCKNEKENVKGNNKHKVLIDECDDEEVDDDEIKHYETKEEGSSSYVKRKDESNDIKDTKSNGVNKKLGEDS